MSYVMKTRSMIIVLCVAIMLSSCGKKAEEKKEVVRPVRTMVVKNKAAGFEKTYPAKSFAVQESDLAFQASGKIIEIPIIRGQEVKKGDLIAKIDARDFENKVIAEKATFVKAQAELDRYRSLYEDGAVSRSELEVQERDFGIAKANYDIAEKALQDAFIYAPFDGVIARQYLENFQNADASQPVVSLQDVSELEIVINVPESDVAGTPRRREDLKASVQFDAVGERSFDLALKEWEAAADSITQTFMVKFVMTNPADVTIKPGMTAKVNLSIAPLGDTNEGLIMIPSSAIFGSAEGDPKVWVIDPTTMQVGSKQVTVEDMLADNVKVTSGIQAGDMIATSGVNTLREGVKVRSISNIYTGE